MAIFIFQRLSGAAVMVILLFLALFSGSRGVASADEPETPKRPVITGKVIDHEGKPVAGAKVVGGAFASWNTDEPTLTDPQGRFQAEVTFVPMLSRLPVSATEEKRQLYGSVRLPQEPLPEGKSVDEHFGNFVITIRPPGRYQVRVVDEEGTPIAGAIVGGYSDGSPILIQETNAKGEATLTIQGDLPVQYLSAYKPNAGFDYRAFSQLSSSSKPRPIPPDGVTLKLGPIHPLEVTVQDSSGKPVEGAEVQLSALTKPGEINTATTYHLVPKERQMTDAHGKLKVDWLPAWQSQHVTVTASSDRHSQVRGQYAPMGTAGVWTQSPTTTASGGKIVLEMQNTELIKGTVRDAAGNPVPGVEVSADSGGGIVPHSRGSAKTDDQGKYELRVLCHRVYLVTVTDPEVVSDTQVVFELNPDQIADNVDLTLRPAATRLHGQVRNAEGLPAADEFVRCEMFYLDTAKIAQLNLPDSDNTGVIQRPVLRRSVRTDSEGRYSLLLGPGFYSVQGQYSTSRSLQPALEFEVTDEAEREIDLISDRRLSSVTNLRGRVITGDDPPRPVGKAQMLFVPQARGARPMQGVTNEQGQYNSNLHALPTWVRALTEDGKLGAIEHREAKDTNVPLEIHPLITATGQLLHEETGNPMAGRSLQYSLEVPLGRDDNPPIHTAWFRSVATDDEGRFTLTELLSGGTYTLRLRDDAGNLSDPIKQLPVSHGSRIEIELKAKE